MIIISEVILTKPNKKITSGIIILPNTNPFGKLNNYQTKITSDKVIPWAIYLFFVSANHHFHFNAEFHPLLFHPVLGITMAVVAVKNIKKGSEVGLP